VARKADEREAARRIRRRDEVGVRRRRRKLKRRGGMAWTCESGSRRRQ